MMMTMSGTEEGGFNVHRNKAKCRNLNLHERLLKEISVSDLTEGAEDALHSLYAKRGNIDQLRGLFNQRLTFRSTQDVVPSATVLPFFVEKKTDGPPF